MLVVLDAPTRRLTQAAVVVAAGLLLAGCGGSAPLVPASKLSSVVLQRSDLPAAFEVFDEGAQVQVDAVTGPRRDPSRFGRDGGWKSRFRRTGATRSTRGAILVESRADVFGDEGGAKHDLAAYEAQFTLLGGHPLRAPALGDGAAASTQHQAGGLLFYTVAWRERNATASVTIEGFDGKVSLADALALARKQERRLQRA